MNIEFLWKTTESRTGNCPALYRVNGPTKGYVVQGKKIDAETRAQLRDAAIDEDAVFVPDDVLARLTAR